MDLSESLFIPRGEGQAFEVRTEQVLRLLQPEQGGQVADCNAWNLHDPRERFWGSRTALYHGMHVKKGDQLYSTWPGERVMFTILEDTVPHVRTAGGTLPHDVMTGRCSRKTRMRRWGTDSPGCQETLAAAIAGLGLGADDVHDCFNPFMLTGIGPEDSVVIEPSNARPGDRVDFRAEIDCLVAISSCRGTSSAAQATGLIVEIYNA